MSTNQLAEAKARLPIGDLWRCLGLPGEPPAKGTGICCSPFRPDRHPSFSIFADGMRWKDMATGEGGTAVEFIMKAEGCDSAAACRRLIELAGGGQLPVVPPRQKSSREVSAGPGVSALKRASDSQIQAIAELRGLEANAVAALAYLKILRTGVIDGFEVWGVVDGPPGEPPRVAEVRRIDGGLLPVRDSTTGVRVKGKALRGSRKDWPAGASLLFRGEWSAVLLCEGLPDLLAAAHFADRAERFDLCPVTILGRTNQTLHPGALELLAGRRIRVYPHADPDGGGIEAAARWASMIPGSEVDWFDFGGLRKADGSPVKDLNDCAFIHPDDQDALRELLP